MRHRVRHSWARYPTPFSLSFDAARSSSIYLPMCHRHRHRHRQHLPLGRSFICFLSELLRVKSHLMQQLLIFLSFFLFLFLFLSLHRSFWAAAPNTGESICNCKSVHRSIRLPPSHMTTPLGGQTAWWLDRWTDRFYRTSAPLRLLPCLHLILL